MKKTRLSKEPRRARAALPLLAFVCLSVWSWPAENASPAAQSQGAPATQTRALIIVIDGLRPDYITAEAMPNLAALRGNGFWGENHHSVFPTVTRVNATSIATGSYPRTHGMMGNSMYVKHVRPDRPLNTGYVANLRLLDEAWNGNLLTTLSLGEILQQHGKRLFVSSSGSSGSAFLLNHRVSGGALVQAATHKPDTPLAHQLILPDTLAPLVNEVLGPVPARSRPNLGVVRRAVDALLKVGIDHLQADVMIIWITEPDGMAHTTGVGSPQTVEALKAVDVEVRRILAGLGSRGLLSSTNIFVTSDHGFSTHVGRQSIVSLLVEHGLKATSDSLEVVVAAGGAIHVNEGGGARIRQIVHLLQQTEWIGPVFTRGEGSASVEGWVPGTLSFGSILWDHERSADILAAANWTSGTNVHGFAGEVMGPGLASHGSASPYDIGASFIISGPSIKQGVRSRVPTGNTDLVPTILHLLELPIPATMDGRVLVEALAKEPAPSELQARSQQYATEAVWDGGTYRMVLHKSFVGSTEYVDFAEVTRR